MFSERIVLVYIPLFTLEIKTYYYHNRVVGKKSFVECSQLQRYKFFCRNFRTLLFYLWPVEFTKKNCVITKLLLQLKSL